MAKSAGLPEPLRHVLDACAQAAVALDSARRVIYCNEAYARANGKPTADLVGAVAADHICRRIEVGDGVRVEIWLETPADLLVQHGHLIHQEKMLSLGRLVAGIAHELNNPINFIYGNVDFLNQYVEDLVGLVQKLEHSDVVTDGVRAVLKELKDSIEWDYLLDDSRKLLNSIRNGAERTATIVRDLKNFSRVGSPQMVEADLVANIEITLNLIAPLYRGRIQIVRKYEPDIPKLVCNAGHLAQVFMNVLTNAAQAIEGTGTIWIEITTVPDRSRIRIAITDNGRGISSDIRERITDPFFTTKDVGEGTGLGLWITESIISAHRGTLSFTSEPGHGSTFVVELPIRPE